MMSRKTRMKDQLRNNSSFIDSILIMSKGHSSLLICL